MNFSALLGQVVNEALAAGASPIAIVGTLETLKTELIVNMLQDAHEKREPAPESPIIIPFERKPGGGE